MALFDVIQTLDRPKLAGALARGVRQAGQRPQLFIQVNTGEEPQKSGVAPTEADGFIAQCRDEFDLPIAGLMCIPPVEEEPALHFALLAKIARRNGLAELSMGMSADFETAIALDATASGSARRYSASGRRGSRTSPRNRHDGRRAAAGEDVEHVAARQRDAAGGRRHSRARQGGEISRCPGRRTTGSSLWPSTTTMS